MKYVIRVSTNKTNSYHELNHKVEITKLMNLGHYNNIKKAVTLYGINYGAFRSWKSKNKIDYPINYKGYLFERIEVK
jgi:hypothetical protein